MKTLWRKVAAIAAVGTAAMSAAPADAAGCDVTVRGTEVQPYPDGTYLDQYDMWGKCLATDGYVYRISGQKYIMANDGESYAKIVGQPDGSGFYIYAAPYEGPSDKKGDKQTGYSTNSYLNSLDNTTAVFRVLTDPVAKSTRVVGSYTWNKKKEIEDPVLDSFDITCIAPDTVGMIVITGKNDILPPVFTRKKPKQYVFVTCVPE